MGELVFVGEALLLPVVIYLGGIYAYAVLGSVWLYLRLSGIESKAGTLYQGRGISSISLVAGILHAISMETMHRHPLSVFLTRIYACYFLSGEKNERVREGGGWMWCTSPRLANCRRDGYSTHISIKITFIIATMSQKQRFMR
eukprot:jgi/Bigna1/73163/fgenesh1_pg.23_\